MGAVTFILIMPLGVQLYNGMSWLFRQPVRYRNRFGIHQGFVPVYATGLPRASTPCSPSCAGRCWTSAGALQPGRQGFTAAHSGHRSSRAFWGSREPRSSTASPCHGSNPSSPPLRWFAGRLRGGPHLLDGSAGLNTVFDRRPADGGHDGLCRRSRSAATSSP